MITLKAGFNPKKRVECVMSGIWDDAKSEAMRMLSYASRLEPHRTQEMCSLNEARRIIVNFTPVMTEITTCIQVAFILYFQYNVPEIFSNMQKFILR